MDNGDGMVLEMMDLPSCLLRLVNGNWSSWNYLAESLTLGVLGPCFPWGSIISGYGHSYLCLWMLNSLPSDCDILHFFTALCSFVVDFMMVDYAYRRDNHVCHCILDDCVDVCSAVSFAGCLSFFTMHFNFSYFTSVT